MEFDKPQSTCPLCNSENIVHYITDFRGIHIHKCNTCKVRFMNPQYSDDYLKNFYSSYQNGDTSHHIYGNDELPRKLQHKYNLIDIEKYVKPGNFLSIGSGNAFDILEAVDRGWNAEGFDVDNSFVEKIIAKYQIKMKSGNFLGTDYPKDHFSCIYLNQVLEHPKTPGQYLQKIHSLLRTGGILYIACPNLISASNILKNIFDKTGLKKTKAKHYDTWQHLTYFKPFALKKYLEHHYKFKVLKITNDIKINKENLRPEKYLFSFPYKSSFRMIIEKT